MAVLAGLMVASVSCTGVRSQYPNYYGSHYGGNKDFVPRAIAR